MSALGQKLPLADVRFAPEADIDGQSLAEKT
jgi:hypothetical protein